MAHILFPLNVRLSTWATLVVFLAFGVRDRRYWWAAAAWIGGFEIAYQLTQTATVANRGGHAEWWAIAVVMWVYACGIVLVIYATQRSARPSWPLLAGSLVLWGIWIAAGFHVNSHTMTNFDPTAEALNEGAKTLWAAAYFWPLWKQRQRAPKPLRADLSSKHDYGVS